MSGFSRSPGFRPPPRTPPAPPPSRSRAPAPRRAYRVLLHDLGHGRDRLLDLGVADQPVRDEPDPARVALEHPHPRGREQRRRAPPARSPSRSRRRARCSSPPPPAASVTPGIAARARASERARRWSSATRSSIVSRATSPAAAAIPARWKLDAAESVQHLPRPLDDRLAAGEHRPERRREALVERDHDRVRGRGELGERDSERDGRVHEPGAVDVDAAAVPLRGGRERRRSAPARASSRPPACACSRARAGSRRRDATSSSTSAGSMRPSSAHTGAGCSRAISVIPIASEVRTCDADFEHDVVARLAEREERGEVRHPAGRHPDRRRLAEQLRDAVAELVHRGVLAHGRPAELGLPHRLPHLLGRDRAEIGAEVDHRRYEQCRPGARRCARRRRRRRRR